MGRGGQGLRDSRNQLLVKVEDPEKKNAPEKVYLPEMRSSKGER